MSRSTGNRSATPGRSGSPLLTGILVGMVIGVAMAAGLAWYLMKSPSPFVQSEQVIVHPPAEKAAIAPTGTAPASAAAPAAAGDGKPRFEFYKVLTDKPDATRPQPAEGKSVAAKPAEGGLQYLQAGSFSNADDAEKRKAHLALMGIEATIQVASLPDKGVMHRVRTGPYKNADEMVKVQALMKQNGVEATPTRAQ